MDMDVSQYKELFVSEASEHLEALNQSMLELEKDPENPDMLTEIFRSAHTLKGMAATLGFDQLTELSHEMENVLDGLRAGDLTVTPASLDLLFNSLDTLGELVKAIAEDSNVPVDTRTIIGELRGMVEGQRYEGVAASTEPVTRARARAGEAEESQEAEEGQEGGRGRGGRGRAAGSGGAEPEPEGAAGSGVEVREAGRAEEPAAEGEWPQEERVGEEGRRKRSRDGEGAAAVAEHVPGLLEEEDLRLLSRESVGGLAPYLLGITLDQDCVLKSVRVFMVFKKLSQVGKIVKSAPPVEDLEDEKFEHSFQIVFLSREDETAIRKSLATIAEVEKVDIATIEVPEMDLEEPDRVEAAVEIDERRAEAKEPAAAQPSMPPIRTQSVRVNITRLDSLMNLVGELVINRTRLSEIASSYNITELKEALAQTTRLSTDLQDEVMKTRMVPVEHIFNRFPRMVRDLAKSQGKDIDFTIEGKEIELDRTILDEITTP